MHTSALFGYLAYLSYVAQMAEEQLRRFIQSYISVSSATLEHIVGHFEERSVAKNEVLLQAGKVSNEYFFLIEGFMRAFTHDPDGEEVTTYFFSPDHPVFEVSSLFLRQPSAETIQAITNCRGYYLSFPTTNQLFHSVPEFREFGRTMLVREFAAFKQRALSLINRSADERYADLMTTNPALFQHAQLKHIASYLGVTDSSLSRIRREYARRR